MIQARMRTKGDRILSLEMTGHADFAAYGSDIVCAAASSLAITAINAMEELAGFQPILEIDEEKGGYLYVEVLSDLSPEQEAISQIVFKTLRIGLAGIHESYGDFLNLTIN